MAAIAKYIVRKPFEHEGVKLKIGDELILDQREADVFYKKGYFASETFLDPDDPKDASTILRVKNALKTKKAKLSGEYSSRQAVKQENAAEADARVADKRKKLVELSNDEGEVSKIDNMTESQLDRNIEKHEVVDDVVSDQDNDTVETTPTKPKKNK